MKIAVVADIHGNLTAFRHVLSDAAQNGAEQFIIAGDYCLSNPCPREVVDLLMSMENAYIIRGNEEGYLNPPESDDGQFEISRWVSRELTREQIKWLTDLPEELSLNICGTDIKVAHRSTSFIKDTEDKFNSFTLAQSIHEGTVSWYELRSFIDNILDSDAEFPKITDSLSDGIYIFGHTHVQWNRKAGGKLFINPGSCGLPLDRAEEGAPYTLLDIRDGSVFVEERRVPYDMEKHISSIRSSDQYKEARVWSEVIIKELSTRREHLGFFLQYANRYADITGDLTRPFIKKTWEAAFDNWNRNVDLDTIVSQC